MKCSKCNRSCNGTGLSWFKLVKEDIGPVTITPGFNQGSKPFFLLCPWCFEDILGGVKPYVTHTIQETKKIAAFPITTYTEGPTLHISSSGDYYYEDPWGEPMSETKTVYINEEK